MSALRCSAFRMHGRQQSLERAAPPPQHAQASHPIMITTQASTAMQICCAALCAAEPTSTKRPLDGAIIFGLGRPLLSVLSKRMCTRTWRRCVAGAGFCFLAIAAFCAAARRFANASSALFLVVCVRRHLLHTATPPRRRLGFGGCAQLLFQFSCAIAVGQARSAQRDEARVLQAVRQLFRRLERKDWGERIRREGAATRLSTCGCKLVFSCSIHLLRAAFCRHGRGQRGKIKTGAASAAAARAVCR